MSAWVAPKGTVTEPFTTTASAFSINVVSAISVPVVLVVLAG